MKLKRILSIPFAVTADIISLGNMGRRTFTQQVFDAEREEQESEIAIKLIKLTTEIIKAAKKVEG